MNLLSVPALGPDFPASQFKNQFIDANRPALLKQLCRDWPAFSKWSFDYFSEHFGSALLPISQYGLQPHQKYSEKSRIPMQEYLAYVKNLRTQPPVDARKAQYAAGWHFEKPSPELRADIQIPTYFNDNLIDLIQPIMRYEWMSLFLGHPHSESPLHTDSFFVSTWLSCIKGNKLVRMIPGSVPGIYNGLDVFNEEILTNLGLNKISIFEVTIQEGDSLFIPSGWWHHIVNLDESIALSCNYVSKSNFLAFEQQVRARILNPLIKLNKVTRRVLGEDFSNCAKLEINPESLRSSKYIENELKFIDYMKTQLNYHQTIVERCPE